MARQLQHWKILLFFGCIQFLLTGCSGDDGTPELGQVTGVVKMDDKPLPNALVEFHPQDHETGRHSSATTDEDGYYKLEYSLRASGAMLGKHTVKITTQGVETEYASDGSEIASKQKVPAKYNVKSELVEEVKAGSQKINFDLDSKGEIVQVDDSVIKE